jgi:hypothetical protein
MTVWKATSGNGQAADTIACPSCGFEFEPALALRERVEREVRSQLDTEAEVRAQQAADRVRHDVAAELERKDAELAAERKALAAARARVASAEVAETELLRRKRELDDKERSLALSFEKRLDAEKTRIQAAEAAGFKKRLDEHARREAALVAERTAREAELVRANAAILAKENDLQRRLAELELEAQRKLDAERETVRKQAATEARERAQREAAEELRRQQEELAHARRRLDEAAERERELTRSKRELEDAKRRANLAAEEQVARVQREAQKQLADARREAELSGHARATEAHRLALAEQKQKEETLVRQLEELKQRATQGSQQAQGEAQERVLREMLQQAFRHDEVSDVPKGIAGGDVTQRVRDPQGADCGLILWESKRTKTWSDAWLTKLREDQRAIGAQMAVIVTQALPQGVRAFQERDGIWICAFEVAIPLAATLRALLVELAGARRENEDRSGKMERLYDFLTGPRFRQQLEGIMEAYGAMREDLDAERRFMTTRWKRREVHLEESVTRLGALCGEMKAIARGTPVEIPDLSPPLELLAPPESDDDEGGDAAAPAGDHEDPRLVELLFRLLPADGTSVGNATMLTRFTAAARSELRVNVGKQDYERARARLVDQRRIRRGQGRGGSVMRTMRRVA